MFISHLMMQWLDAENVPLPVPAFYVRVRTPQSHGQMVEALALLQVVPVMRVR